VKLVEVGPRDGLQNESQFVPAPIKTELINRLSHTGLQAIEVTSFVSAKKIPQLADAAEVFQGISKKAGVDYSALVPNNHGLDVALAAGVKSIAVFGAVSESFSQQNINCSIEQSFQRFDEVITAAKKQSVPVRGYLSCCLDCPYEGHMSPAVVADLAKKLWDMGCYEICLGDTIGVATAKQVHELILAVAQVIPREHIAMHFHDTYGQALTNIYVALQQGIQTFDCSVSGLGGCPYAQGATGNVASEDVVYMMHGLGIKTGVNLDKLIAAGQYIDAFLQRASNSKVALAQHNKQK